MPKATVDTSADKYELESCPGAYVSLKRMPYGAWLHRQDIAMKFQVVGEGKTTSADVSMANEAVTQYEFTQCIVDHNLEDENGTPLDFRSPQAFAMLDPKIGNEIGKFINELHDSGN